MSERCCYHYLYYLYLPTCCVVTTPAGPRITVLEHRYNIMHRDVGSYIISGDFYIRLKRIIIIERGMQKKKKKHLENVRKHRSMPLPIQIIIKKKSIAVMWLSHIICNAPVCRIRARFWNEFCKRRGSVCIDSRGQVMEFLTRFLAFTFQY